jgi:hypothetical protein
MLPCCEQFSLSALESSPLQSSPLLEGAEATGVPSNGAATGWHIQWYQHRGCPGAAKDSQNTIAGALRSLAQSTPDPQFAGLELDVCWDPAREAWLVCHDPPAPGPLTEASPPALDTYLSAVAPTLLQHARRLQLEVKSLEGDFVELDRLLRHHRLTPHVMVSSFEQAALRGIAAVQLCTATR